MKATLFALFVALFMVGCGGPDLDGPETLDGIIAEAIDVEALQKRGARGEELYYAPNEQTLYTGWSKEMHDNGQISMLAQFKDGEFDGLPTWWYPNGQKKTEANFKDGNVDGPWTEWYKNGQKKWEGNHKDGRLISALAWKPNGEKCSMTNLKNGNGIVVWYNDNGTEKGRLTYKDGEIVD